MYDTVFFDLDGTVTDSAPGILNSVRFALRRHFKERGIVCREYSDPELNCFIGPPLIDTFQRFLPCTHAEAEKCLGWYREYFLPKGIYENSVYPGIVELFRALKSRGVRIVLATAKPEPFARIILDHFGLSGYFAAIHGATMGEERNKKHQVIEWALGHSGEVGRVIMVGDRENDVSGAMVNGLDCIGVLWGYGDERELAGAGAARLCSSPQELLSMI